MSSSRVLPIAADHPVFAGHFPGTPILPGAVLLDETLRIIELDRTLNLTQWQLASVKFQGVVRPGDAPVIEHSAAAGGTLKFTLRLSGRAVLTGTLSPLIPCG